MLEKIRGNLQMLKSQPMKGRAIVLKPGLAAAVGGPGKPCFCRRRTEDIVDSESRDHLMWGRVEFDHHMGLEEST